MTLSLFIPWQVESLLSEWMEQLIDVRVRFVYGLRKLANFGEEVTVGSICTGWGVGDMVVDAVNKVIQSRNQYLQGRVPGSYPKARWVELLLDMVFMPSLGSSPAKFHCRSKDAVQTRSCIAIYQVYSL